MTGIYYHQGSDASGKNFCRWNFILSNLQESAVKCDFVMTKHILPNNISKVQMVVYDNNDFPLQGLRFFDKTDNLICEIGKSDVGFLVKELKLEDSERIVGFASRKGNDARHYDFQFMIAKLY